MPVSSGHVELPADHRRQVEHLVRSFGEAAEAAAR